MSAVTVFQVKGWAAFQHYSNRRPVWIKLHRSLLDDVDFHRLPVASRALAPMLWLLASESVDGSLSADPEFLAFRLRMSVSEVVSAVNPLLAAGFLVASGLLAECYQVSSLETEKRKRREETEREKSKSTSNDNGKPSLRSEVDLVFKYWQDVMGHPDSRLSKDRIRVIEDRLREGYTVEQIKAAVDGCRATPWNRGENPNRKVYDGLELICRNAEHLDRFRQQQAPTNGNGAPKRTEKEQRSLERAMRLAGIPVEAIDGGEQRGVGPRDVGVGTTALARRGSGDGEPAGGNLQAGTPSVPDGPRMASRRE